MWSIWSFMHDTTAVLSWDVHNVVTIWYLTMETKSNFSPNLNYERKIAREMVNWYPKSSSFRNTQQYSSAKCNIIVDLFLNILDPLHPWNTVVWWKQQEFRKQIYSAISNQYPWWFIMRYPVQVNIHWLNTGLKHDTQRVSYVNKITQLNLTIRAHVLLECNI